MVEGSLTTAPRNKPKLRVLVVDDSEICRATLVAILQGDGDIEVIGEGEDGFTALTLVEQLAPDLVTMDVQMPGKNGLEAVEQIMARDPVPILVVTAAPLTDQAGIAFAAIQNGALDIVAKPSITDLDAAVAMRSLVRVLAAIPVFKRVEPRTLTPMPPIGPAIEVVAVASGKGGIASVIGLLSRFPEGFSPPVVLFEPMPQALVEPYAKHLSRVCKLPVRVATRAEELCLPGEVLLVPASRATWIGRSRLRLDKGAPSAMPFFRTLSQIYGSRAAGVVLRGEVVDGADALAALHDAGGKTFAEVTGPIPVDDRPLPALPPGSTEVGSSLAEIALSLLVLAR